MALRWPTIAVVLLVSGVAAAQHKSAAYSNKMQRGNSVLDQARQPGDGSGTDGWIGDQIQKAQKAMQSR